MTPKRITVLFIGLMMFGYMHAQTRGAVDTLEERYQACLDKGRNGFGCAKKYYFQVDSMVHLAYTSIYEKLDTADRKDFKKEQIDWITQRDKYFKSTYITFKQYNTFVEPYGSAKGAQEDARIMFDKNAKYIRKRADKLIRRLEKMEKKRSK